jgi:predicted TIM-barrel fold metal-dependent hydrolase
MRIKYGLISCDSHGQLRADTWTERMSKAKWGTKIPHLEKTQDLANMVRDWGEKDVERWKVNDKWMEPRGVANASNVMRQLALQGLLDKKEALDSEYFPQRWADLPKKVYDPIERLKAMDEDGIDAEVLFHNTPVQSGYMLTAGADFELDIVKATNDGMAEYVQASDRYIPLTMLPYLSGIETTVAEVERATKLGHRGINMISEPSTADKRLKHFNDRYWDPLWAVCQDLNIAVHWHSGAGVSLEFERWKGFTNQEAGASGRASGFITPAEYIPNALFSGVLDRYPKLKFLTAESGLGWVNYILEGCDHEWERHKLWAEGLKTRPSELFRRQMYVDFWYEAAGIELRHDIGLKNIVWESDFPHPTATYPDSWKYVDWTLSGVPKDEKDQILWKNAVELYGFKVDRVEA